MGANSHYFQSMLERYVNNSVADEGGKFSLQTNVFDYSIELQYLKDGQKEVATIPFFSDPTYPVEKLLDLARKLRNKVNHQLGNSQPVDPCSFGGCI